MRYIDTGTRDPAHALGTWLREVILNDQSIAALRWQSGFFSAEVLAYFAPLMGRLRRSGGVLHVLVGSNDGATRRSDIEALLSAAGPARATRKIGVVKFAEGYFHPKTVHVARGDGSSAAYVGSANLTGNGVALHAEAGLVLDTREGDDPRVLDEIRGAVDGWFAAPTPRPGLNLVPDVADLDALVRTGILDMPQLPRPRVPGAAKGGARGSRLKRLLVLPSSPPTTSLAVPRPARALPAGAAAAPAARWTKTLTRSDAQRKAAGNQRGSITLVQAGQSIDSQTYFRRVLFGPARWAHERTRTGETRETARVRFDVDFLGGRVGPMDLEVTYAPNRESKQANYTSLLHLGPLAQHFSRWDVEGKRLVIERRGDGTFALSISDDRA